MKELLNASYFGRGMVTIFLDFNLLEITHLSLTIFYVQVTIMTLSEEKTPLISLLKPLLWQLVSSHLKVIDTDSQHARLFKTSLSGMLTSR